MTDPTVATPTLSMFTGLVEFSYLDRLRLLSRYWTWDIVGYRRALLSSTYFSRAVLHADLHPMKQRKRT